MASATLSSAPPVDPSATAAQPRKRRRRAPATGAADDCFTCANLGITCDRRRPYCSQCLGDGKDCSGYKTTLTWGVGVASRGKLRGLSLPVAGTAKVNATPSTASPKKRNAPSSDADGAKAKRPAPNTSQSTRNIPRPPSSRQPQDFTGHDSNRPQYGVPNVHLQWQGAPMPPASKPQDMAPLNQTRPGIPHEIHPITMPVSSSYTDSSIPASATSIGGFSDFSYPSPVMYSASSEENHFFPPPGQRSPMSLSHIVPNFGEQQSMWPQSHYNTSNGHPMAGGEFDENAQANALFGHSSSVTLQPPIEIKSEEVTDEDVDDTVYNTNVAHHEQGFPKEAFSDNSMMLSPFANVAIGKTPRMQYLINYYAEVISPVIVAFDGPNNPYRTHILRLAMESETLQHAIAALSASNLRQRREGNVLTSTGKTLPARRSSMALSALTDKSWQSGVAIISPEDQIREELLHKRFSIQTLNSALADPVRRRDDSILATLLILCLFHICDSGIAKFQTQFAGVKKLLNLRTADLASSNTNASSPLSKETSWYTRMFTWFDAFTATVNDREGQLQGTFLDISSLSDEEWALENLVGCDGRLFKIMAKLGRLTVLSRNGSVEPGSEPSQPEANYPRPISHDGPGWNNMQPLSSPSILWPLPSPFEFPSATRSPPISDAGDPSPTSDTRSSQFWNEWNAIRASLMSWQLSATSPIFSPSTPTSTLPLSLNLEQKADLVNISESFRYSALLYLERLAHPAVPCSDVKIQSWVNRALGYIKLVKSDVFLLWPLFITGSECIKDKDRKCIRQRCLDIQKDSGFMNNWSTLELLEKIWTRIPADPEDGSPKSEPISEVSGPAIKTRPLSPDSAPGNDDGLHPNDSAVDEGFRWRAVMKIGENEGEYIVV